MARHRKYLPYAFIEHGALMAATVLNSPRAVAMGIYIIRAFVQMREDISANAAIHKRLAEILGGGVVARSSQNWPPPKIHCRECRAISGTQYQRLDMLELDPSRNGEL